MEKLTEEQRRIIKNINGPMMVLAGPGSGKTFTMTRRLKEMIQSGISPENILVITFTKASAIEMQERFEKLMEGQYFPITFGTFHAVFFSILKEFRNYQVENIIHDKEKHIFISMAIEKYKEQIQSEDMIPENLEDNLLSDFSKIKNYGISPFDSKIQYITLPLFAGIYDEYKQLMKNHNLIDFDDMMLECKELLTSDSQALKLCQDRYKYILIDEFQDINPMQYKVIQMLALPENNLFIVGDDDQSIYGFRGSKPEIMLNFGADYPSCKKESLSTNYRSSMTIVNSACKLIANNKTRFTKTLKAASSTSSPIVIKDFNSTLEEYDYITKIITTSLRNGRYKDTAIIFRTNKGARNISAFLSKQKIPFLIKEKTSSLFNHPIAKDILSILDFAYGNKTRENFLRFMNKPVRYISRNMLPNENIDLNQIISSNSVNKYVKDNIRKLSRDIILISRMDVYSAINYIRNGMGYENFIVSKSKDSGQDSEEILSILKTLQACAKGAHKLSEYKCFIEDYEKNLKTQNEASDAVTLITMHGSKGLEYKNVIIPDLNEGVVPPAKCKSIEALEEERRVFYVAITRAKKHLYLLYLNKGLETRAKKSRFIDETILY